MPEKLVFSRDYCVFAEGFSYKELTLGVSGSCLLESGSIALKDTQRPLPQSDCRWELRLDKVLNIGDSVHLQDSLSVHQIQFHVSEAFLEQIESQLDGDRQDDVPVQDK